ncbi:MAG TPA: hypothetical protein H9805_06685 [Candidatus Janibacter merdipullorum]|nr:hypothetical protein [Candidatus Janibacter merdipullorum]
MQNTTTHAIDGLGLQGFSPDELTAVLHYLNDIAGIPDAFDGIEESGWDIAAGIRGDLSALDVFQMFAAERKNAEEWIEAAHHLRYSAVDALDITKPFELYADFELHKAAEALRCLAGHALDEITGRRED